MNDIEMAKKYLEEENLTIAVVKNGKLIYKGQEKGIKPMYTLATKMKEISRDASIADRVIGKGAAMLCKYIDIKEVYGQLISSSALKVLEKNHIVYSYDKICPYIKNRDKTDLCPIEKLSIDVEDIDILLERIEEFLKLIK
jgi:tyrosine-protein phosphatase YwqE